MSGGIVIAQPVEAEISRQVWGYFVRTGGRVIPVRDEDHESWAAAYKRAQELLAQGAEKTTRQNAATRRPACPSRRNRCSVNLPGITASFKGEEIYGFNASVIDSRAADRTVVKCWFLSAKYGNWQEARSAALAWRGQMLKDRRYR
jgi:hypothetical protein